MDSATPPRLYFAYGSNLSPTQMSHRCPSATPVGLAHLPNYTFIINSRRYANVVRNDAAAAAPLPTPTSAPGVYGVLYTLPPDDEAVLDRCEGVPHAYQKQHLTVNVVTATTAGTAVNLETGSKVTALVYVDTERTEPSTPWDEYVDRMNRGVDEATELFGLPQAYVDQVIRPYITAPPPPSFRPGASGVGAQDIEDPFLKRV
ncbi:AIG2 family protein [Colletotrichum orchidophilum]|uniref:gamma-glutamylcyclotransferase n=1 Tax=Colletotrichum orchidophilum TaxID=1209926 RepID=A0A1G4AZS3_9PEZI|nr:AIG2 family protein [Colletotrichum orchidophilum]OHE94552.1 AIG2 family protein [Colletotrichum orchidophilum]